MAQAADQHTPSEWDDDRWTLDKAFDYLTKALGSLKELFPPDGLPPVNMLQKTVCARVNENFAARGEKLASRDTVARATGRRTSPLRKCACVFACEGINSDYCSGSPQKGAHDGARMRRAE